MRRPLVVGNWKMHGSKISNDQWLRELGGHLQPTIKAKFEAELAVCVPFIYIQQVSKRLLSYAISCGAQDISMHAGGAHTGEVAGSMLADFDCRYVIVGHSERRREHGETNELVAQKALAAVANKITPIICLGETQSQRESGDTLRIIEQQLEAIRQTLSVEALPHIVLAYEPVWAIGTGLTANPKQAQEVHHFIRGHLQGAGNAVRILYGGSVKADNAAALFQQPDIDGALVGGASLDAHAFIDIAKAA